MERLLASLLPLPIFNELYSACKIGELTEIRLRTDKPIYYAIGGRYRRLGDGSHKILSEELQRVLSAATKSSLYAYNSNLVDGYITYDGGIRIGVSGEGVLQNGKLTSIKNITSLCIRIPHYIEFRDKRIDNLIDNFGNTLIVSKPGYGKTTLLRYMIKTLSDKGYNVLVLDERGELSGMSNGRQTIDLGECSDIVLGVPKIAAYSTQVRSMRPDIIATDEIFGQKEIECIADCVRCGVKVIATVHSDDLVNLRKNNTYSNIFGYFKYAVTIVGIGNIDRVVELKK